MNYNKHYKMKGAIWIDNPSIEVNAMSIQSATQNITNSKFFFLLRSWGTPAWFPASAFPNTEASQK
jgi:hypothetical protein